MFISPQIKNKKPAVVFKVIVLYQDPQVHVWHVHMNEVLKALQPSVYFYGTLYFDYKVLSVTFLERVTDLTPKFI
jgi:hypothetical protein